jgi:hypothetical protein
VGISYGTMSLAVLGGERNEWTQLLGGEAISYLSHCVDSSKSRECVISSTVAAHIIQNEVFSLRSIDEKCSVVLYNPTISYVRNAPTPPPPVPHAAHGIEAFVPTEIVNAVHSGVNYWSELRSVTCIFMKLDSYSPELHSDLTLLQPLYTLLQQAIHSVNGFIRQFIVDDKGCVLIALWGTPSTTYPDNAQRALHCAYTMQQSAKTLNHEVSLGITTGVCYCGTVGRR